MTHNYDDADEILMGLMFDKPEPHLAEEDCNMGDEAFIRAEAFNDDAE